MDHSRYAGQHTNNKSDFVPTALQYAHIVLAGNNWEASFHIQFTDQNWSFFNLQHRIKFWYIQAHTCN